MIVNALFMAIAYAVNFSRLKKLLILQILENYENFREF